MYSGNLFMSTPVMKGDTCYSNKGGVNVTDENILRFVKKRRQRGLAAAVEQYGAYVATIIRNVLGSSGTMEDCEELSGDVFFALWQHPDGIAPEKLKAWLGAVARNRARDLLRKRKPELPMDQDVLYLPDVAIEDQVYEKMLREQILAAVQNLSEPDKDIFLFYYYHYDTMEEIALRLGLPLGTVKSKLHRGRQKLKEILSEQEVEAWN